MQLLTVAEAAEQLNVSVRLVYRLVSNGDLVSYRIGQGAIRIRHEDLDAYVESRRQASHGTEVRQPVGQRRQLKHLRI